MVMVEVSARVYESGPHMAPNLVFVRESFVEVRFVADSARFNEIER